MSDDNCPCEGERTYSWHRRRGIKICEPARLARNVQDVNRRRGIPGWIPGTSILVPEIDPL